MNAIDSAGTGGIPAGIRLSIAPTGGSSRSAPNGASPLGARTRLEAAPSPDTSSGRPTTRFVTSCSLVRPRQNGPCTPMSAVGPPIAPSRIAHPSSNRPTAFLPSPDPLLNAWCAAGAAELQIVTPVRHRHVTTAARQGQTTDAGRFPVTARRRPGDQYAQLRIPPAPSPSVLRVHRAPAGLRVPRGLVSAVVALLR